MYYHHSITYPDGTRVEGKLDHMVNIKILGLTPDMVQGKRVLDLGANDGFFSFWSEWGGASEVISTDVENYRDYDWGPAGPPPGLLELEQQDKSAAFWEHHSKTGSSVQRRVISAYESNADNLGYFDIIFNYGLIYHLRYPRLCIDNCAEMCTGTMFLETEILFNQENLAAFTLDAGYMVKMLSKTDGSVPTMGAVIHWLKFAGFPYVFVFSKVSHRTVIVATRDEEMVARYRNDQRFNEVTDWVMGAIAEETRKCFEQYKANGANNGDH